MLHPAAWDSLTQLTALNTLVLTVTPEQLPRLSHLPASVESLSVHIGDADIDGAGPAAEDAGQGTCDLAAVVDAAARAPGVLALSVRARQAELRHTRALADAAAATARLRTLEIVWPKIQLHDISALAMMPGLTRLGHSLSPILRRLSGDDDHGLPELAQHAAGGLQIAVLQECQGCVTPSYEPW